MSQINEIGRTRQQLLRARSEIARTRGRERAEAIDRRNKLSRKLIAMVDDYLN